MKDATAAHLYAQALFNEALKQKQLDLCLQGLQEFNRLVQVLPKLRNFFAHPFIAEADKAKMIHSVLDTMTSPLLEKFLLLIISKGRLMLLSEILAEFQMSVDRQEGVEAIQLRSAVPISSADQGKMKEMLEKWLKSKVRMTTAVEPELIGGVVVEMGDRELDQSVRTQLKRLRVQLGA